MINRLLLLLLVCVAELSEMHPVTRLHQNYYKKRTLCELNFVMWPPAPAALALVVNVLLLLLLFPRYHCL